MENLSERIKKEKPSSNEVFLYWIGGAGYIIKGQNLTVGLDLYLSDVCRNDKGDFKRLVPAPLQAVDIHLDFLISTHDHGDHFDVGSIRQFVNSKTKTKIIGPGSVIEAAEKMNFDPARLIKLDRGDNLNIDGLDLTGVFADHGSSSTDCIGVIICLDKKNIYFTSDTCYRPDLPNLVYFKNPVDLLIVPINGKYGNPDSKDAFYIASWVKPKTAIPSHFWLFKEHGGDPGLFAEHCKVIADEVRILVPAIGEKIII